MKLPIFKAYGACLAYLGRHFVDLVKALWLPALALLAVQAYFMPDYMNAIIEMDKLGATPDPAAAMEHMGPMAKSGGAMFLATLVFYPMLIVASLRHVVRGDTLKAPFYLGFGGDELRVLGGGVLLLIMFLLIGVVGGLALGVLAAALSLASPQIGGVVAAIASLAFVAAFLWFTLRMSLTFPAAIGTRTVGLAQSWRVTKGNSLRLLAFWILVWLILLALYVVYMLLAAPALLPLYSEMIKAAADQAAQAEISTRMLELQRDMFDPANASFWLYIGATYVMTILSMSVMGAASGVAWRYVSGAEAERA